MTTNRLGSVYGSGFSRNGSARANIAAVSPTPSMSTSTVAAVAPGRARTAHHACLRSTHNLSIWTPAPTRIMAYVLFTHNPRQSALADAVPTSVCVSLHEVTWTKRGVHADRVE